jgi:hypothetical protein
MRVMSPVSVLMQFQTEQEVVENSKTFENLSFFVVNNCYFKYTFFYLFISFIFHLFHFFFFSFVVSSQAIDQIFH